MKLGAFCVGALVLVAATAASADNSEKVTLRDGSVFVGELVEKVPGNHITLKLATGEVRRIEWAAIAEQPTQAAQAPATEAPAAVHLTLDSTRANTMLFKLEGGGMVAVSTGRGMAYGAFEQYSPVCTAPCEANVDPNGTYKIGGGITETGTFSLPARSGALALHVNAGSRGMRIGGAWATLLGGSAVLAGGLMLALGFLLTTDTYDNQGNITGTTHSTGLITAGAGVGIGGIALLALGIPLMVASSTRVDTDQGAQVALGHSSRFAFTSRGLVF